MVSGNRGQFSVSTNTSPYLAVQPQVGIQFKRLHVQREGNLVADAPERGFECVQSYRAPRTREVGNKIEFQVSVGRTRIV